MPTSPTITTVARSRHSSGVRVIGRGEESAAHTSTASAPRPRDQARICSVVAAPDSARARTPAPAAVAMANGSGSIPATSQPEAIASRAASWPSSPRPSTTTLAPGPASDRRSACSGMDASVANAASSAGTGSGTAAHSRPGTAWNSA